MQTPLVQLHALLAAHQGGEQGFRLVLQVAFVVAAQAAVEQPQAALQQYQPDQQQGRGQAEAETALDRPHPPCSASPA
ncbi:hypothetical protein D3C78_1195640 [compost metagenome]